MVIGYIKRLIFGEPKQESKLKIENLVQGINASPLEDMAKRQAIRAVENASHHLNKLLDNAQYHPPEDNFEARIANDITIRIIGPILLEKFDVAGPNIRDTNRHMYVAIGGRNQPEYEVTEFETSK